VSDNQKTLKSSIEFAGVGLHTGEDVHMVIEPAKINHGVKFQRVDLENQPILNADINLVTDTQRCTTLEKDNVKIVTVEHLMSALYALGVNNY
jgi:UDP-3-O-[3-hydroxymyristoyl] N-acetylglucosamine deacetylase/3-hydroxyacyl-[acyl-carrier-protein] dehydratase